MLGTIHLFIMSPHTQDTNGFFLGKNFVRDPVLNADAARVSACKIFDQFFEGRRILKRIIGKYSEQFLRLWFETTC